MPLDNVILFGAGASADAGIPMLNSFVDKMWEYAIRGKVGDTSISEEDRKTLTTAIAIRDELDAYNSRAYFDSRNLEDILSLLSFEALNDGQHAKYELMVKAVARTIELSGVIKHQSETPTQPMAGTYYHAFWHCLFHPQVAAAFPALITFNYDLVLERTLWDYFHHLHEHGKTREKDAVNVRYHYGIYDFTIHGEPHRYNISAPTDHYPDLRDGERAEIDWSNSGGIDLHYLKLHGSLNWDREQSAVSPVDQSGNRIRPPTYPTEVVESPLILPPVFNKMNSAKMNVVWNKALEILRNAKNIVIVGYSLPKTDIYMQYFLKSAVGPNKNLQRIIVFDPLLWQEGDKANEMKQRYKECFAPQFAHRIDFRPAPDTFRHPHPDFGKFWHFVETLRKNPRELFFYP